MSTDGDKATVSLAIKDRADLRDCYMPFVKNGGLFLAGKTEYSLGDQVDLLLELPDEPEPLRAAGKVVWLAGEGVKSPHRQGIGIQFTDPDNQARDRIETHLGTSLGSTNATATM